MPFDIRFKLTARRLQRQMFPDARHNILQRTTFSCMADDIIDRDQWNASIARNFSKPGKAPRVIAAVKHSGARAKPKIVAQHAPTG